MSNAKGDPVTVFYDGACPLCQAEIAHYKKRDRDGRLHLIDVSDQSFAGDARLSQDEASSRFHIRTADGQQFSGARAFVEVWRATPGWRWLARLARIPAVIALMERLYRLFLLVRPHMVRVFTWLKRTGRHG